MMRVTLQSTAAECSLACLAMVASAHGLRIDLADLRRRFPVGLKGANLQQLISHARALHFSARPLRLDLHELPSLATPCILHWDLNHFVVLMKATNHRIHILDPAAGERSLRTAEASRHFTGIALELAPDAEFTPVDERRQVKLSQLTGRIRGLHGALARVLVVALVLQLFAIVAPLFNQLVVDEAIASHDTDLLDVLSLGFALLLVVQTALGFARSWMVMTLGQTLSLQWAGNVFAHLLRLPATWFEQRHLGDVVSRFGAVGSIQRTLTTAAIEAVLDGLMASAAVVMMWLYAPTLTGVVVGAVVLYGLLRWAGYRPFRDAARERLIVAAKEQTHFLESLRAIVPLKLFGHEAERHARWQNLVVDVHNRDVRTARLSIFFATANALVFGVENLLVIWLGARMVMDTQVGTGDVAFTIGMLFAFVSYKQQFTGRVSALIQYAVELRMLGLHGERLADIALAAPESGVSRGSFATHDLSHLEPSLELRSVSFRYGEGEPWILRDVNLVVAAGESVALVGPSGAGKTTLLKLLLGLEQPSEGEVLYGGIPIRQLGVDNVRRLIGTVLQDDLLLSGSLADNVSFFDAHPNRARIEACTRMACVHDEVIRMPMGYETLVGDLGSGLSGGQKQRLLLARALYKQPRVLALDEVTSHLDLLNEQAIGEVLAAMRLTRIVIAHRPDGTGDAQRVIQVCNGVVAQQSRDVSVAHRSAVVVR